jgi:3-oxoadipate enol-lactonase
MAMVSTVAGAGLRRVIKVPQVEQVPVGRVLDLPGRGSTYVVDVPGPTPDAPTVVLLHALACTAYLSWYPVLADVAATHRVVAFDQRWHGRGIRSPRFRFADCADDAAAVLDALGITRATVAGYSMGGAIAQLAWRRHRDRVEGLVLCATARNFKGARRERVYFPLMSAAMLPLGGYAKARVDRLAATLPDLPSCDASTPAFGRAEFRSTSAWSIPAVMAELGRFNSAAWVEEIDVPTSVVVTSRDHTIPTRRQLRLAECIPGSEVFHVAGGHGSLVLGADAFRPAFTEALGSVARRAAALA